MESNRPLTLHQWIAKQLTHNVIVDDGDKLINFSLVHVKSGCSSETGDEIKTITLGSKDWSPKEIADSLDQIATTVAAGIPGRQQFVIFACYLPSNRKEPFPFGKLGESEFEKGLATEPANERGFMAQMMRHNEAMARITTQHQIEIFDKLVKTIEITSSMNERLLEENAEVIVAVKNMVIEKAADEFTKKKELLEYQRTTAERAKLLQLAPVVINKAALALTGKELIPVQNMAVDVLKNLADTLTEDQVKGLAGILTPEQLTQLAPVLMSLREGSSNVNEK